MGNDGGESSGGYSSESESSETSFESNSSSEVSSSDVSLSEVTDAFDESGNDDVNDSSERSIDLTETNAENQPDVDATPEETDVAFNENSPDLGEDLADTEISTENEDNSDKGENVENETEVLETEKENAFNEKNESKETQHEDNETIETADNRESENEEISEVDISELPLNVQESYKNYENENWTGPHIDSTPGTKGGGEFSNRDGDLPSIDENGNLISYKEFDVNNKPTDGTGRDGERFIIGSDGSVYYTGDHYDTFVKIK